MQQSATDKSGYVGALGQESQNVCHEAEDWGRCCSMFFINDLFYFALECKLYNYADDNTLPKVGCTTKEVLDSLVVLQDGSHQIL